MSQPVALVSPAPQGGEQSAQKGYGFLNASMTSETATKYSGENVSSMFNMTSPIPAQGATQATADARGGVLRSCCANRGGLGGACGSTFRRNASCCGGSGSASRAEAQGQGEAASGCRQVDAEDDYDSGSSRRPGRASA